MKTLKKNTSRKNTSRKNTSSKKKLFMKNVKYYSRKNKISKIRKMRGGDGSGTRLFRMFNRGSNKAIEKIKPATELSIVSRIMKVDDIEIKVSIKEDIIQTLLSKLLESRKTLSTFTLSNTNMTQQDIISIIGALLKNTNLTELNISKFPNIFDERSIQAIISLLKFNDTITLLDISNNDFSVYGLKEILDVLKDNTTITSLNISNCKHAIEDANISALRDILKENKIITTLDISNNNFSVSGLKEILDVLKDNTKITSLNISNCKHANKDAAISALRGILKENKIITSLNIGNNNFGYEEALYFSEELRNNNTLISLNISNNSFNTMKPESTQREENLIKKKPSFKDGLSRILNSIGNSQTLTELDISGNLDDIEIEAIILKILYNNMFIRLNKLNISNIGSVFLDVKLFYNFLKGIKNNKTLISLNISENWFIEDKLNLKYLGYAVEINTRLNSINHLKYLGNVLQSNTTLKLIDISCKKSLSSNIEPHDIISMSSSIAIIISNIIEKNNSLTDFYFNNQIINEKKVIEPILKALKNNYTIIDMHYTSNQEMNTLLDRNKKLKKENDRKKKEEILSKYNIIVNDGVFNKEVSKLILDSIINKTSSINISSHNISDAGAFALAEALKVNTLFTALIMNNNNISDAGTSAIAEALKVNTPLTTLIIINNNIGNSAISAIAEALKVNKTLTTLIMNNNNIGNDGAQALAQALGTDGNKTLKTLDISINKINNMGIEAIIEMLKTNTSLTSLNISSNVINNEIVFPLAEALKVNETLTTLDITHNNIGIEGTEILEEALKVNTTLIKIDIHEHTNILDQNINSIDYKWKDRKKYILKKNIKLELFIPKLTPTLLNLPIDDSIVDTINYIKEIMKFKYKNKSKNNTDESLFNEYVKQLTLSNKYFNTLIRINYNAGNKAIKTIIESEKYLINLHGSISNRIFKLPDNINIVFVSPVRYMVCMAFFISKANIEKYFDEYLKNPYCIKNTKIKKLFSDSLIYYGGQYCIDLNLYRVKLEEHVTGIHYMKRTRVNDSVTYKIKDPYLYSAGNLNHLTLSEFLESGKDSFNNKFNNTGIKYTILLTSCRESLYLDKSKNNNETRENSEDLLVFYEQILKGLNEKICYDNKDEHNGNNKVENIYTYYKNCKSNKIYMEPDISQMQKERTNISKKGKIRSRNNSNINNTSVLINTNMKEHEIKSLIESIESIDINDITKQKKIFNNIFDILDMNIYKFTTKYIIPADMKLKIKIIKYIFKTNYLLLFEFLIHCQKSIKTVNYGNSVSNSVDDLFFLRFMFDNIKELQGLDISNLNYPLGYNDSKILLFIQDKLKNNKLTSSSSLNNN